MRQITWNEYFMALAMLSSYRSKDPNTKVGACIADDDHKVVSIGYNGMPRSIDDNDLSRDKGKDLNNKYLYVCHAEFNAILNTRNGSALKGCTLYVTLFPCNECAKAIIQTGIKKVVYMDDKYANDITTRASKKMLTLSGVELEQYKEEIKEVLLK